MNHLETRIRSIFRQFGLPEESALVYLDLLDHDVSLITEIATRLGIQRARIYEVLPILKEKGLVIERLNGKRKHYSAESPRVLASLFANFQATLEQTILDLENMHTKKEDRPIAKLYEGKKGIMAIFSDVVHSLPKHGTFYRYSGPSDIGDANAYLPADYHAIRDKKELSRMIITRNDVIPKKKQSLDRDMVGVPREFGALENNITEIIYGDKIAFIDYSWENGVIIEHSALAHFQEKLFRMNFKLLRKIEAEK